MHVSTTKDFVSTLLYLLSLAAVLMVGPRLAIKVMTYRFRRQLSEVSGLPED